MLRIYQNNNPEDDKVLRTISKEVEIETIISGDIQSKIKNMFDFIEIQPDGAALSAPQVGINLRFFIVSKNIFKSLMKKEIPREDMVFINPKIIKNSKKTQLLEEGCFSVRWYYGDVERFKNVTIEAYNAKGEKKTWNTGSYLSQIFQHEIDHLDGILFIDKAVNIHKMSDEEILEIKNLQKKLIENKNK